MSLEKSTDFNLRRINHHELNYTIYKVNALTECGYWKYKSLKFIFYIGL